MCGGAAPDFIHPPFPSRAERGERTPFELSSRCTAKQNWCRGENPSLSAIFQNWSFGRFVSNEMKFDIGFWCSTLKA